jgi:uncharacterized protein
LDIRTANKDDSFFVPPFYLRNPVVQTVLSSLKFRNRKVEEFDRVSKETIIDAGKGVRLSGFYSEYNNDLITENVSASALVNSPGKLLILLHGWEGSEKSAYMVAAGRYFYNKGFSIFRLNMRDHGNSHHLNEGLFYGTLIEEAYSGVKKIISDQGKGKDIFITGFSMGGNFALRIARLAGDEMGRDYIKMVTAINPPLNPRRATANIDRYYVLKKYFMKKWKKSLIKKEECFPDVYSFSRHLDTENCIELTEKLVREYSEFENNYEYFSSYTLGKDFFEGIKTSVTVITAEDDPIIEAADFNQIKEADNRSIKLFIEKHGGHCAYIKNLKFETWLFDKIFKLMNKSESDKG